MPSTKRISDLIVGQGKPNIVPPAPNVSDAQLAALQELLADLHDSSGSPNWNDPWEASIGDILRLGLDGIYRFKSGTNSGTFDTPGAGAIIQRDGSAVEVVAPELAYFPLPTDDTLYPDPWLAQYKTTIGGSDGVDNVDSKSGATGFVSILNKKQSLSTNDKVKPGKAFSGFLAVQEKNVGDLTPYTTYTRIPADTLATATTGTNQVTVSSPLFFSVDQGTGGPYWTAMKVGFDFIEVTFDYAGTPTKQIFLVDSIVDETTITVAPLGGGSFTWPATENVTIRWIQNLCSIGGDREHVGSSTQIGGFVYCGPGFLGDDQEPGGLPVRPPIFAVGRGGVGSDNGNNVALQWGYFDEEGAYNAAGNLEKNKIVLNTGWIEGNIRKNHAYKVVTATPTDSYAWDFGGANDGSNGSCLYLYFSASGDQNLTITLDGTPELGQEIVIIIRLGGSGVKEITWPTTFLFSGTDGDISGVSGDLIKFTGNFSYTSGSPAQRFYMTRTDY